MTPGSQETSYASCDAALGKTGFAAYRPALPPVGRMIGLEHDSESQPFQLTLRILQNVIMSYVRSSVLEMPYRRTL